MRSQRAQTYSAQNQKRERDRQETDGGEGDEKTHGFLVEMEQGGAEELVPLGQDLRGPRPRVGRWRVIKSRHLRGLSFQDGGSRLREAPTAAGRQDPLYGCDPLHLTESPSTVERERFREFQGKDSEDVGLSSSVLA